VIRVKSHGNINCRPKIHLINGQGTIASVPALLSLSKRKEEEDAIAKVNIYKRC
jgi:hypothetical protein